MSRALKGQGPGRDKCAKNRINLIEPAPSRHFLQLRHQCILLYYMLVVAKKYLVGTGSIRFILFLVHPPRPGP